MPHTVGSAGPSGGPQEAYADSLAQAKIRSQLEEGHPIRFAMLDIDSTLTGDPEAADRVRQLLERDRYMVAFNTSRTEEMVMSRASYEASRARGEFHRPPPHLGRAGDRRIEVPQEEAEPRGLLDPDIIAGSTGTRILARLQDGSYIPDETYGREEPFRPTEWRGRVFDLIEAINAEGPILEPAAIEFVSNYQSGVSDVYPPDYRVQLGFEHPEDRAEAVSRLHALRTGGDESLAEIARRIRIIDDSEPREDRYKAFVVPRWASKARAARHVIDRLCRHIRAQRERIHVLFVGDSYPDLHMALVGGVGVKATLLLVGGSRLTDLLWEPNIGEFAGTSLRALSQRLTRASRPGYLSYRHPCSGSGTLSVVIGDKAFPGTTSAGTVEQYLRTAGD